MHNARRLGYHNTKINEQSITVDLHIHHEGVEG
jgi:hypothetical protein